MMKKTLLVCLSLLLIVAVLSGCAQVTQKLDEWFPENTEVTSVTADPNFIPMPDRTGRVYTVLLATRAESAESLTTLSLLTFDTAGKSVHWLQIPANLFVHVDATTLAGAFNAAYREELAKEGNSHGEATLAAMKELKRLLSMGLNLPIDYYVSFDPDQLASVVTTLQGIPVNLPSPMGGFNAGEFTMQAKDVRKFLTSYSTQDQVEARRVFSTALWTRAAEVITSDNLTLYASQLRLQLTTDIPVNKGEDIFFWRHFLQNAPEQMKITHLSTQSVYYNNTACQVLNRANTLRQLNEQTGVYEKALADGLFDTSLLFTDENNALVRTVYHASAPMPELYTMAKQSAEASSVSE